MDNIVMGILAHVDAGKTTLSEAILYKTGCIRNLGRVDNKDSFLDNDEMERKRGITIYSKQAEFSLTNKHFSLLDTPGHVDFAAEMERTLHVLDYAILVISGSDGIQGHSLTLWKLLKQYKVPTFIFVNKMDQPDNDKNNLLKELQSEFGLGCIDFSGNEFSSDVLEEIALIADNYYTEKDIISDFLETGVIEDEIISELIEAQELAPCYFGSALKLTGIDEFLQGISLYMKQKKYPSEFGGRVFKITRDNQGNRLTHIKITGGTLNTKDVISDSEKINQIRIYSGEKYDTVTSLEAGRVCSVTGLTTSYPGQHIGYEKGSELPLLEPVLTYKLLFEDSTNPRQAYSNIKILEEEMPELAIDWLEERGEIYVKLMGQVQIEILKELILNRFGYHVKFDVGTITYKETVADTVIGVGHFEPLRHYAEAHIKIEPGERGSGIEIFSDCSEDKLDKNWQRLIMTHLKERVFRGVLTGNALTDVKFTVINGKAHNKHTEGGDFRQATYRAVRQGLMQSESVLLEPIYSFRLEIPTELVGRAMTDLDGMHATMNSPDICGEKTVITGKCPVATMRDYQINVNSYTHGTGSIFCSFFGYDVCHNQEDVVSQIGYNPDLDNANPSSSVFCAHGSGYIVTWDEVKNYMHVSDDEYAAADDTIIEKAYARSKEFEYSIDLEEIDAIMNRTYKSNEKTQKHEYKKKKAPEPDYSRYKSVYKKPEEKLLIVDGYNVIFAWEDLKSLADINIDSAKDKLISILSNHYGITGIKIILVFDGYKVKGNTGSEVTTENITVTHTKEGQTADIYIENYTNTYADKYNITVVSSDNLIKQITSGHNCNVMSSKDLKEHISLVLNKFRDEYNIT